MSRRTTLLLAGSAAGCSILLLCACIAVIAGYAYWNPVVGATNRIAYIDDNNNVQVVDARGENRIALTADASDTVPRVYLFPTWSPNSQRVAFVGVSGGSATRQATLYTAPTASGKPVVVFQSATQTPFYLYWSPNSQWIGFLAQNDTQMALMLARSDGSGGARQLDTGSPFYWAWSPDSRSLLLHVGGSARDSDSARLALLPRDSAGSAHTLQSAPANFESPHYSPDGSTMLFAATSGSLDDALYLADAQGGNPRSIVTYRGAIAFAWSPDGKKIATLVTPENSNLPDLGPIWVSDADGNNRRQLTHEDALAFYWSPDSQQIAYLTIAPSGGTTSQNCAGCRTRALAAPMPQTPHVSFQWRAVNVATQSIKTIATFAPTDDFLAVLPYFDQYARSLTFWSPDSRQFVYTQDEGNGSGSVWVATVTGSAQPRRIGDGTIAVWSWR